MRGDPTLWLPGLDHAGIATQNVVEKEVARESLSRHDLGREKFVERVWQWVHKYRSVISHQQARLGASCDWDRELFTMDDGPQRAVRTTFVKLYDEGLIYKGKRIINWCPRCQTALSDLEVDHREQQAHLWYVRYPLLDDAGHTTDEYIVIATTRPETIVADVAVAVNPSLDRWRKIVGRRALLPIIERPIPIVADEAVDPEFGTGALKITPGHDPADFEIGERHGLPTIVAVAPDGTMNAEAGPYEGRERFECRRVIVADLERMGLLEKTEEYHHSIGHCDRCDTIVEPIASEQWFMKMESLARPAIEAVVDGRIQIVPRRFNRVYLTGWRTSATGASRGSSGGDTASPSGTAVAAASPPPPWRTPLSAGSAARPSWSRTRMSWTPGSPPLCGRTPRWAGRGRRRTGATSTPRPSLRPDTTLSSSGWRA